LKRGGHNGDPRLPEALVVGRLLAQDRDFGSRDERARFPAWGGGGAARTPDWGALNRGGIHLPGF